MAKIVTGVAIIAATLLLGPVAIFPFLGIELFTSTALATAFLGLGAAMILGGVAQSLQHGAGSSVAVRQSNAPWQIVYGRQRVGGIFVYLSVTNDKKYLHMVIVHAAHPCNAINGYWLDGRLIYFSGGGQSGFADNNTHTDPSGNQYNFHGQVYVAQRMGVETSAAFPELTSFDSNWTGAILQGHCCSYIRCNYEENMWPDGYPQVRVDINGRNDILDPRTGITGYSENPALCLAHVLCDTDYGVQCSYAAEIDQPVLIAAANLCDEQVALANGGYEPRYTCNGTFDCSMDSGTIGKNMLTACAGRITDTGGLWRIFPAAWIGSTASFTDDDFIGPIKWMPKRKYRDLSNAVRGRFVCPSYPYNQFGPGWSNNQKVSGVFDGQWQACDIPYYAQDTLHGYGYSVRINCGAGGAAAPYSADSAFSGGATYLTTSFIDRSKVIHSGAAPEAVYKTGRYQAFTYTVTVNPAAIMNVRLHFAEAFFNTAGGRKFHVTINGTRVLTDFDIFVAAGGEFIACIKEFTATSDASGHIVIRFDFGSADFPAVSGIEVVPIAPDANLAADNNTRLWMDVTLPYTISVAEAQRLLKINLLRIRQQGTGTIQVNLKGLQCSALDVIQISHARFGWVNKTFEVTNWRIAMQDGEASDGSADASGSRGGSGPLLYVEMDIQEMLPDVYSWSTAEELSLNDNPSPVSPGQGQISQAALPPVTTGNRNSAVLGGVTPLTASDVGSSVDISVAAWTLQTALKQVSYNSGVIHGCGYSTRYYVYASDKFLHGGAVTYFATSKFDVVTSNTTYVYVDYIITPAQATTPTGGGGGGGGGTGGGPTKGNETGGADITSQHSTGGSTITLDIAWFASNVPSGNIVQLQAGNFGNWSTVASGTGSVATTTATYTFNVSSGVFPVLRVIDISNGFELT